MSSLNFSSRPKFLSIPGFMPLPSVAPIQQPAAADQRDLLQSHAADLASDYLDGAFEASPTSRVWHVQMGLGKTNAAATAIARIVEGLFKRYQQPSVLQLSTIKAAIRDGHRIVFAAKDLSNAIEFQTQLHKLLPKLRPYVQVIRGRDAEQKEMVGGKPLAPNCSQLDRHLAAKAAKITSNAAMCGDGWNAPDVIRSAEKQGELIAAGKLCSKFKSCLQSGGFPGQIRKIDHALVIITTHSNLAILKNTTLLANITPSILIIDEKPGTTSTLKLDRSDLFSVHRLPQPELSSLAENLKEDTRTRMLAIIGRADELNMKLSSAIYRARSFIETTKAALIFEGVDHSAAAEMVWLYSLLGDYWTPRAGANTDLTAIQNDPRRSPANKLASLWTKVSRGLDPAAKKELEGLRTEELKFVFTAENQNLLNWTKPDGIYAKGRQVTLFLDGSAQHKRVEALLGFGNQCSTLAIRAAREYAFVKQYLGRDFSQKLLAKRKGLTAAQKARRP